MPMMLSQQCTHMISLFIQTLIVPSTQFPMTPTLHGLIEIRLVITAVEKVSVEKPYANIAFTQPILDSGCPVPDIGHIF